jgi:hypothetical protein
MEGLSEEQMQMIQELFMHHVPEPADAVVEEEA